MPPLSNDTSTNHLSTKHAHATIPKPLRLEARKDSLVTKRPPTASSTSQPSSKQASSKTSTSSSHSREVKSKSTPTDSDCGPKRGNRAAAAPRRVSAPDVNAFIKHIASHNRRRSNSRVTPTTDATRESAFAPKYAARGHGDMIPRAFKKAAEKRGVDAEKGKITAAVWHELGRQRKVEQARVEAGAPTKEVKGGNEGGSGVLLRALKERAGGYRHDGGS